MSVKSFILVLFIKMVWIKNRTNDIDHTGGPFVVLSCMSFARREPNMGSVEESPLQSLCRAAVVSWTGALNISQDRVLQEARSVRLVLTHPLDLGLFEPQLLQHGRHLAFSVKKCLFVVAAQHCRSVRRKEGEKKKRKKKHVRNGNCFSKIFKNMFTWKIIFIQVW